MTAAIPIGIPKTESVFKPALLLMCGRTLAFSATFFIPVVLARIFDPTQFGTYKQLFLIQAAVYYIANFGMAASLYYFLPRAPLDAGRYVANSLFFLGVAGLAGFAALTVAAPSLGHWLNNDALPRYMPAMGVYLFLMMMSAPLEIVLIFRGKYLWASASYALSDVARAAGLVLPVLLFRQLDWLVKGAVVVGCLRMGVTLFYFRSEFRGRLQFDKALLKSQLAYAVPFGFAVLIEILQSSLPQYVVSYLSSPATFAIFAIGCSVIPLVDFASSPTSDVMMIKMQQSLAGGYYRAALEIWYDATWKLALLFFPMTALAVISARQIIVLVFTAKYAASVPIFMAWSFTILLATFQVDGVMRVFAKTRFILALNIMRLVIIAGLVKWSLSEFHLVGPVLVILLANVAFKLVALVRIKALLRVGTSRLLPWSSLGGLLAATLVSALVALLARSQLVAPALTILLMTSATFTVSYAVLVWRFNLLNDSERRVIRGWFQTTSGRLANALDGLWG